MSIRIAHLSDIHFGAEDKAATEAAVAAVAAFEPTLTVVTGDLTLNGELEEFRAARQWLDRLGGPLAVTPGNHDTPYWNLILRALTPFDRYRRYIGAPEAASFDTPLLTVRIQNSARGGQWRLNWSQGELSIDQLKRVDWRAAEPDALRVFGCHHPLIDLPHAPVAGGVRCGPQAAELLAASGVELVLTGHVHLAFALPLHQGDYASYAIGAGTLSLRTRGEPAGFSTITADDHQFEVTVKAWTGAGFEDHKVWRLPRLRMRQPAASVTEAAEAPAG